VAARTALKFLELSCERNGIEIRRCVVSTITLALVLLAASTAVAQSQPADSAADHAAHWREDLHVLSATLPAKQKDFEKLYPRFPADIESLDHDIPKLADGEVVLRLMKIMASANVAHNQVQSPVDMGFSPRLPLTFAWYAEGLAVRTASAQYETAIGLRVLKIGDKTPEQALTELAPYISHENEVGLRTGSAGLLRTKAVLEHLGVTDSEGQVALLLEKPDGTSFRLTVKGAAIPARNLISHTPSPVPAYLSHPEEQYYWSQYLEDSATLFIQYNSCENDPKFRFSEFAHKALADADAHNVQRVVIDLRGNGGGDSRVIGPLKSGLRQRLTKVGHIYVLIGPGTFSSAVENAIELRADLHATLVGEAPGMKPNTYGEVKTITLPNSKLKVVYTTKWIRSTDGSDDILTPDILAPRKLSDALSGRDAALEASLAAR
jgi:hypothetical protein